MQKPARKLIEVSRSEIFIQIGINCIVNINVNLFSCRQMSVGFERSARIKIARRQRAVEKRFAKNSIVARCQSNSQVTIGWSGGKFGQSAKSEMIGSVTWRCEFSRCQIHRSADVQLFYLVVDDAIEECRCRFIAFDRKVNWWRFQFRKSNACFVTYTKKEWLMSESLKKFELEM